MALNLRTDDELELLESACAPPRPSLFGADAYPTFAGHAAALPHSNVENHALIDGNKRLGWLATVVFADRTVWAPTDAAFDALGDTLTPRVAVEPARAHPPLRRLSVRHLRDRARRRDRLTGQRSGAEAPQSILTHQDCAA